MCLGEVGPSVDIEMRAGHVRVGLRSAEGHNAGHLGRQCDSSKIHRRAVLLGHDAIRLDGIARVSVRCPDRSPNWIGKDRSRRHGIDQDAV